MKKATAITNNEAGLMNKKIKDAIVQTCDEIIAGKLGAYDKVHPNDHVNMGQSTNDVFPTAGKMTALKLIPRTLEELRKLNDVLID